MKMIRNVVNVHVCVERFMQTICLSVFPELRSAIAPNDATAATSSPQGFAFLFIMDAAEVILGGCGAIFHQKYCIAFYLGFDQQYQLVCSSNWVIWTFLYLFASLMIVL